MPVPVRGDEDFEVRIATLVGYLDNKMADNDAISQTTQQLVVQRISQLLDAYEQVDTNAARQLRKQLAESAESLAMDRQAQVMGAPDAEQIQQQ